MSVISKTPSVVAARRKVHARALRLHEPCKEIGGLAPVVEDLPPASSECLVEVRAAGVNMSDVKAALGHMPYAIWPRTPGRDYSGVVVEGPADLLGTEVWGSSGELGIKRDGTLASYLALSRDEISQKPSNITLEEAGAVGVPFVTAYEGLRAAGPVQPGDVVLVLGGNGKVGQAAIQLATMAGARVFAVERTREAYMGHATKPFDMIDASAENISDYVRKRTGGHGADIVYNTVGSPYFEQACAAMAPEGRQIFISTIDRSVPFDIFRFFRGRHSFIGIDSLALSSAEGAAILSKLRPSFEAGRLKPFPVSAGGIYPLSEAKEAFQAVWGGSRDRIVIRL